jgi:hypothetical protein
VLLALGFGAFAGSPWRSFVHQAGHALAEILRVKDTRDTSFGEPCANDDPIGMPYPSVLVQSILPYLQPHESFSDCL